MLLEIFCQIDDFCKDFEKNLNLNLLSDGQNIRKREFKMTAAEIITITIHYHLSGYKTFKDYYEKHVMGYMRAEFPQLVSYNRFIELRKKALIYLLFYAQLNVRKNCTGTSFIDSFSLKVCHIKRASSHKTFKKIAAKGKTSVGWFFGFKLHLAINDYGEIIAFCITPGNVADNNEVLLITLTKKLFGKLFGDRGYLVNEELFKKLFLNGIKLITKIRSNMKNKLMEFEDKLILQKRGIIETVGGILKQRLDLEHTRHRSIPGFFSHLLATLISYEFRPKPAIFNLIA